ncbi:MAG: hypothetical protein A2097_07510, partial [Desulfobacula sp. GWF2_41_7]
MNDNSKSIVQTHSGTGDNILGDKIVFEEKNISNILTAEWFNKQVEINIENLGKRYTPELNIELNISKNFDAICKNDSFRQLVRDNFHIFLLKVNNALDSLVGLPFKNEIAQIKNSISNIENQFFISQKKELIQIDKESLKKNTHIIRNTLADCSNELIEKKDNSNDYMKHKISEARDAFYNFHDFLKSAFFDLANTPIVILTGPAGIGKSHLLADIAKNLIKTNKACIFLLGQHFTSEDSPWTQILHNQLRLDCNEQQFLEALNEKAESQGERTLFLIDAINEGKGRYFWPEHINGFVKTFSKYPWIGLVFSIRSSYEELITPKEFISKNNITKLKHWGFDRIEYKASSFFFSQYGIEQPSVPLLNPEFSNPLFLKLFCEGINRSGLNRIPKGYGGISNIIEFFIQSIDDKLSKPSYFDYPSGRKIIKKVIDGLIKKKLKNNLSFISYEDAFEIADKILSKFSNKRRFLDALISEGVLSKNLYWKDGEYEEGIYLAYERFEDHLTTSYLLNSYIEEDSLDTLFKEQGKLYQYIDNSRLSQGILESLSIQVPERTGKELYELLDEKQKIFSSVVESFISSLIWRKPGAIEEKTKDYVNKYILPYERGFDLFFQMVYSVCTDPDHFYNANGLHRYLMNFSMPDRDQIWTIFLHEQDYESTSMFRLIDWARSEEDKHYLSKEARLLAAKALSWLFTSTNIIFRDSATKALVVLLEDHISTIRELLIEFEGIDDPYVYERIFAAAYGAVLRSDKLEDLEDLSIYIVDSIFKVDEVYTNVLVRDYARNIVEYAIYKNSINIEGLEIIRPPYKSSFPSTFPTNAEIDAYKFDYKSKDFKDYFWGQNSILHSMVTEYGRGVGSYGDFGRYTFDSAMYDWADFDANDLSNYACKLIFNEYKYDVEKHGGFDRNVNSGNRYNNEKERIGKKYQWIALYEVLARLSDNFKMVDESTRWGENKQYIWYHGPWGPFVR